jgi:hypothetical protein
MKKVLALSLVVIASIAPAFALPNAYFTTTRGSFTAGFVQVPATVSGPCASGVFGGGWVCAHIMSLNLPVGTYLLNANCYANAEFCWIDDSQGLIVITGSTFVGVEASETTQSSLSLAITLTKPDILRVSCDGPQSSSTIAVGPGTFSALQLGAVKIH